MTFTIQYPPEEPQEDQTTTAPPQRNNTKAESKASSILGAKDLSQEEYEDISNRKGMGNTTTDENLQAEKHYWQKLFLTKELDEKALKNFLYGTTR